MADFRKWLLASTALVLFAGLASAQTGFSCNASTVPPQLRSEGYTELVGDILLSCSGPATAGQFANVTVYMNQPVTSRLSSSTANNAGQYPSEALLLINDPPTGTGAGTQSFCSTPNTGCVPWGGQNVYQGVVSNSGSYSVTFYGIPVLAPTTTGGTTSYRITNVRINANGLTGGGSIPANAVAAVSISSSTSIQVNNSVLTVGYASQSLKASVSNVLGPTLTQCASPSTSTTAAPLYGVLRYTELQGSAFKWRTGVSGTTDGLVNQNTPGTLYNTESGFEFPISSSFTAGLADYGTRFRAVFNNIPTGVSVYASTVNLVAASSAASDTTAATAGVLGQSSYAVLVSGESSAWTGTPAGAPTVTSTGTGSGIPYASLTNTSGSAEAVWEVTNSVPNFAENFDFGFFISYTPSGTTSPAIGTMTVSLSYAPIYTPAVGAVASTSLPIPRFSDTGAYDNLTALSINFCTTALLFPYVANTSDGHFDTGIAISNTTSDPFSTPAQSGSCSIYWYGQNAPATNPGYLGFASGAGVYQTTVPTSTSYIPAGQSAAFTLSANAPGFVGYAIAVCNFQYAHGFAFISDLGVRNYAMGYVAEVMNAKGGQLATRGGQSESLSH